MTNEIIKASLDTSELNFFTTRLVSPKAYKIDMSKVKTFEDLLNILKAFELYVWDNNPHFEKVKHYIEED